LLISLLMQGRWNQASGAIFSQTFLSIIYKADKCITSLFFTWRCKLAWPTVWDYWCTPTLYLAVCHAYIN